MKLTYGILIVFIAIMVCSLASAEFDDIGFTRLNTEYKLALGCSFNSSYCPATTVCNVSIYSPTSIIVNNKIMSSVLYPQYNYTIPASNLSNNGLYYGRQVCCDPTLGCSNDYSFQFHVNPQGVEYTATHGLVYLGLIILLMGVFCLGLYGTVTIPFSNPTNEYGKLLGVDYKKHLKIFAGVMTYLSFIMIMFFAWNISYGILQLDSFANFFYVLFRISFVGLILMIPVWVILTVAIIFKDRKLLEKLHRGLTVQG